MVVGGLPGLAAIMQGKVSRRDTEEGAGGRGGPRVEADQQAATTAAVAASREGDMILHVQGASTAAVTGEARGDTWEHMVNPVFSGAVAAVLGADKGGRDGAEGGAAGADMVAGVGNVGLAGTGVRL